MSQRFASQDDFRHTAARFGWPLTDEELARLWEMVTDLHALADGLTAVLERQRPPSPLASAPADPPDLGRSHGDRSR